MNISSGWNQNIIMSKYYKGNGFEDILIIETILAFKSLDPANMREFGRRNDHSSNRQAIVRMLSDESIN